jgi:SAM-dependent methyltransferase
MPLEFEPPTQADIEQVLRAKYGPPLALGWGPALRRRFDYVTPDDYYEAVVAKLVDDSTSWADLGCGRDLFPSNLPLAELLSQRCRLLVGVDPSDNIAENHIVHQRVRAALEEFTSADLFDLVTMRMVAEHVEHPSAATASLRRCVKQGGRVVIYTVNRWSLISVVSAIVPFRLHHPMKRAVWKTEEQDTFPVHYRMNTRKALGVLMGQAGFQEEFFRYLDDCGTLARWRSLHAAELWCRDLFNRAGLPYVETCLLGVYRRTS